MSGSPLGTDNVAEAVMSTATLHRLPTYEAAYFRQRASAHRAIAERSRPEVASVHHRFAAAYLAAAAAVASGEDVELDVLRCTAAPIDAR